MTRCATDMHTFQIGPKTGAGVFWADAPDMQGPRLDRAPTHVAIAAAGSYLPGEPIRTEEIEARIAALSPGLRLRRGLLRSLTGIETRHHLPDCMQASDLAVEAARRALDSAGASARDIDLLVWGSASQDMVEPATAHIVAAKLGLRCPVFDVKNACNSFLNGMQVATALLRSGDYRSALVVTGESPSRAIRWVVEDLEAFFESAAGYTMGDAGAALLLSRDPKVEGIFFQKFLAASDRWSLATLPGGGSMHPRGDEWSYFRGNAVQLRDAFLQIGAGLLTAALRGTGTAMEDFARIFCHQVTRPFIAPFCETTGIPPEKLVVTVAELGNIASATIPTQIARTDADSLPRADWIAAIKRGFAAGALFLAGPVRPRTDDHRLGLAERLCIDLLAALMSAVSPYLPHNRGAEFRCRYILASGGNLAIEAGLYRASGGFPRIALEADNEDRILQNRVRCLTASVHFLPDMVVAQSVRRIKRYGLRNTLLWYWNRKYKPALVDIR